MDEVSQQGRNTQGVRLINLAAEEHLVGLAQVQEPEPDAGDGPDVEEPSQESHLSSSEDGADESDAPES